VSAKSIALFQSHLAETLPPPAGGDLELAALKAERDRMIRRASRILARAESLNIVIKKLENE